MVLDYGAEAPAEGNLITLVLLVMEVEALKLKDL
jgi:hypothetical protein